MDYRLESVGSFGCLMFCVVFVFFLFCVFFVDDNKGLVEQGCFIHFAQERG